MNESRCCLNENWVLAVLLMLGFGAGVFGGVNWSDYVYPEVPQHEPGEREEIFNLRVEEYRLKVEEVGKSALIPYPIAVTVCFTGFFSAGVFLFALMIRSQDGNCKFTNSKAGRSETSPGTSSESGTI
jgi:hypothetical protein